MGYIEKVLIIAPTSVVAVWPKEFKEFAEFKYTCKTLLGAKKERIKALDDLMQFPFKAMKVAVINYESTWREGIKEKLQEFDADLIICDESQRIKTHDAAQSKAVHELGDGKIQVDLIRNTRPEQCDRHLQSVSFFRFFSFWKKLLCIQKQIRDHGRLQQKTDYRI